MSERTIKNWGQRKTSSAAKYSAGYDAWMANIAAANKAKVEAGKSCPAMDARQERLDCIESKFECSGDGMVTYTGEKPASFEVDATADIITQSEHDSFVPGEGQDCE